LKCLNQWKRFESEGEYSMNYKGKSRIPELISKRESDLLASWIREQLSATTLRGGLMKESELREQSREFLNTFIRAVSQRPELDDINEPAWEEMRDLLSRISRSRAHQGFSPTETATFVFSLKQPMFALLRRELEGDPVKLAEEQWVAMALLDKLGLYTIEAYQKGREEVIRRQQQELLELSTPVVLLWEGILGLPLIGTLDSARTQVVMESMLQKIVETGAAIAIIDITGVPTVDTLVAQHLLKTVSAARLMGADCIISGIRPQIAQTIVHLGVNLSDVITKSTLADAFAVALRRSKMIIKREESHD
jgi:rsbT co-antagonist protein RsbR